MIESLTCMILAGGLGTRLRRVLTDEPKPMASINGHPFLEYLIAQIRKAGLTDIVLCLGHKAQNISGYFGDGRKHGVKIRYSVEKQLLGTAGAIKGASSLIRSDPFIVLNGDSFCEVDFDAAYLQHQRYRAEATIVACKIKDHSRYGSLMFDRKGLITAFSEKQGKSPSGYISGGIYIFNKKILDLIPGQNCSSWEKDIFPQMAGKRFYVFKVDGPFIDIGTPESLKRAALVLKKSPL